MTTEKELLSDENSIYPDMYMGSLPEMLQLKETVAP